MIKTRVYEVAKELGIDNRELVMRLASLGIQVRNHMSSLEPGEIEKIKRAFDKNKNESTVEEKIRPTVVRRRVVAKPEAGVKPGVEAARGEPIAARKVSPTPKPNPEQQVQASAPTVSEAADAKPVQRPSERTLGEAKPPSESPATRTSRFAHGDLPPGVIGRGSTIVPGVGPLSKTAVSKIVAEHATQNRGPGSDMPRRRELNPASMGGFGPARGASNQRPMRRKMGLGKRASQKPEVSTVAMGAQKRVIRIEDNIQLQTLAQRMSLKATDVLMKLMQLGMMNVNVNSTLDEDTAKILASEFNYEVENVAKSDDQLLIEARGSQAELETDRVGRPPVVTVMGHVDHGKTSLLDAIRSARVAAGEAGGITQHIGAYHVETAKGPVVFLDTPGHEAFTAMRARGAQSTDVVILVVAADDGVMPQTREAINHAKAAHVPIVVAVNKVDKPDAQPERVRRELANEGLQAEEWGGDTMFVEVSAKTKQGIDKLLENVALQAEVLELRGNPKVPAEGVVLESYLDKGRGPVANVLVKDGTLRTGDFVLAGTAVGKVRAMSNDRGKAVAEAGPSMPVELLGLSEMPQAGDVFFVVADAKKAQEIAEARKQATSKAPSQAKGLEHIYEMMQSGETQDLKLVVKADVQGSVEAIQKALTDLSTDKVKVVVIHSGVGGITENDVMLASASKAIIVGFNVRPAGNASNVAKAEKVDVRLYSIIYEAIDEIKQAMTGLLAPKLVEKSLGQVEVRETFNIPKVGTIAGCFVLDGKINRNAKVRVIRDSVPVWEGGISSLRRFKDDVKEVAAGYECGISLEGFNDVKIKDIFEAFEIEEVQAQL